MNEAEPTRLEGSLGDEAAKCVADHLVISGANQVERAFFLRSVHPGPSARLHSAVLCADADMWQYSFNELPVSLGSYFAVRLTARGFVLPPQVHGCMYALADAVKASSAIDVFRWRVVLGAMSADGHWTSAATRLVRQSERVLHTLMEISDASSVLRERKVLEVLRFGR
ncbi:hypothetical protein [Paraburkholderia strydomiana]|uniref:AraC family transcriptional regulator n=1 Tax=Paraburkholderia strydomiana TaxID=1245417 RepID=A0ABW9BWD6_9BURK